MFNLNTSEHKDNEIEKKITELEIQNDNLNLSFAAFLRDLKLTTEQIDCFVNNPDNFSKENWEELQRQKQQLDEKLKLALDNIRNPLKNKKAYAHRKVDQHWLYVR
jgi:hypothetical protein